MNAGDEPDSVGKWRSIYTVVGKTLSLGRRRPRSTCARVVVSSGIITIIVRLFLPPPLIPACAILFRRPHGEKISDWPADQSRGAEDKDRAEADADAADGAAE